MITVTGKAEAEELSKKAMNSMQRHYLLGILCLVPVSGIPDVCLARADITPRVRLSEIYTDNIDLVDTNKKSEWVTELTPGFNAIVAGGRVNASVDYQMQALYYSSVSDTTINHQLEANSTTELYQDTFFVDADASIFQAVIDPEGTVALDNVNNDDNRTDVYVANVSPYWKQRFAASVDAEARYRYGIVHYDESDDGIGIGTVGGLTEDRGGLTEDSTIQEVRLSAGNLLEASRRWTWQTAARYATVEYDDNAENTFRTAVASLGYRVSSKLQLILDSGVDDNDFERKDTADTSGPYWNAGLRWNPSVKNRIEAGFGRRYDENMYNFLWAFQGRRSTLNASYSQTLETDANVLLDEQTPDIPDIGGDTPNRENLFRSDADVFKRKLFSTNATINWAKSSLSLGFSNERRESVSATGDEDKLNSLSGIWNWRYSGRTSVIIDFLALRQEFGGGGGNDDIYRAIAGLTRQLGPRSTGAILFVHSEEDADGDENDYEENRVILSVKIAF